ncbi:hypothetical protein [Sphingobacterium psychroaquaticum]|uniref:Uncharacterized protein n=1 Tax=Sphingobacterium psychroaquaticum TaxID=561061 RepID=A0A1X7KM25_9SPHI|nr:hypothetical protein [Sphingobacterium psychroaquaticum]QBQ40484.1 hypothetical protein E2P86_04685 [Sphingobacterium psychroaquaticum]SMG42518.1 hypothetical protein SAMN05660862_3023 [Sphingobacterium psychroaquaticum]
MDQQDLIKEIGHIRSMMEKSSKFISISGLSGVLIGMYALIGAFLAYIKVFGFRSTFDYRDHYVTDDGVVGYLVVVAVAVLLASLITGVVMAKRKASKIKQSVWNVTSRAMLKAVSVPLMAGGLFALLLIWKGYYELIASTLLIFYGLALSAGSVFTFKEVRWLGVLEVCLGLAALLFPGYGLWFWVCGFGLLHIIYGFIVYKKYE